VKPDSIAGVYPSSMLRRRPQVNTRTFHRAILALLLGSVACARTQPLDLACDRYLPTPDSRLWTATHRLGQERTAIGAQDNIGRLVIRGFTLRDSTALPFPLHVALSTSPEGASEHPMLQARQGMVTLDVPADIYTVETRCFACPSTRTSHTVVAGRTDTLDFYLGQMQRECDAT
jgi:hypothetical protein